MDTIELGEIIATRNLELVNSDGTTKPVVVKIGKPRPFPDSTDFLTPYQIMGVGKGEVWYAGGVDAIQSIQLVMGMIGAELNALITRQGLALKWLDDESLGLGFAQTLKSD